MERLAQHQSFWDQMYFNPEEGLASLFELPSIKQAILKMTGQQVQPIQQQMKQQHVNQLLEKYGPELQKLHPMVAKNFKAGRYGTGEQAAIDAIADSKQLQPAAQAQPPQPPAAPPAAAPKPKAPGQPTGKTPEGAVKDRLKDSQQQIRDLAKQSAKARVAMMNGKP
jgi:hypothetical protein